MRLAPPSNCKLALTVLPPVVGILDEGGGVPALGRPPLEQCSVAVPAPATAPLRPASSQVYTPMFRLAVLLAAPVPVSLEETALLVVSNRPVVFGIAPLTLTTTLHVSLAATPSPLMPMRLLPGVAVTVPV